MPVLNVPFRLIAAYNPQRGGVLNNNLHAAAEVHVQVRGGDDVLGDSERMSTRRYTGTSKCVGTFWRWPYCSEAR